MSVDILKNNPNTQKELGEKQKELFKGGVNNIENLLAGQENSVKANQEISEALFNDMFESPKFLDLMNCFNKEQNIGDTCDFFNNNLVKPTQQNA